MVKPKTGALSQIFLTPSMSSSLIAGLSVSSEMAQTGPPPELPQQLCPNSTRFHLVLQVWSLQNNHAQFARFSRERISRSGLVVQTTMRLLQGQVKTTGVGATGLLGDGALAPRHLVQAETSKENGKRASRIVTRKIATKLTGHGHLLVTGTIFNATISPTFMLPNTAEQAAVAQRTYRL
jgi:hypothetical protein